MNVLLSLINFLGNFLQGRIVVVAQLEIITANQGQGTELVVEVSCHPRRLRELRVAQHGVIPLDGVFNNLVHTALAAAAVPGHQVGTKNQESKQAHEGNKENRHQPAERDHRFTVVGQPENNGDADEDIDNDQGYREPIRQVRDIEKRQAEVHLSKSTRGPSAGRGLST